MRLRAKRDLVLSTCRAIDNTKIKELSEGKLYTGSIKRTKTSGEFHFICFNDQEEWQEYDISFFEPKEIAEGE